jgi:hypothetical protein
MSLLDRITRREYIVTLHSKEDLNDFYLDLETDGKCPCNTDINRSVTCSNRRPSSRNTHYLLCDHEARQLLNDLRVKSVELSPELRGIRAGEFFTEQISNDFDKSNTQANTMVNWGLKRCYDGVQTEGWGSGGVGSTNAKASGTVKLGPTGRNVDVVICDGDGLREEHPEYAINADGTGGSRAQFYNWFQHDPEVKGTTPGTYVNSRASGHAIHVMGTVGGNLQGWARNANMYNIFYYAGAFGDVNFPFVYDYIREFHRTKSVNSNTGRKNPTIVNNSWGMSIFPNEWSFNNITAVNYRGQRFESGIGGTVTYTGTSGVHSSSVRVTGGTFTGNPENLVQDITTLGAGEEFSTGSFAQNGIPNGWTTSGEFQATFLSVGPYPSVGVAGEYEVRVNGPVNINTIHNIALSSEIGIIVELSGEVEVLDSADNRIAIFNQTEENGNSLEVFIDEIVNLPNSEEYKIFYRTTINTGSASELLIAAALSCTLETQAATEPSAIIVQPSFQAIESIDSLTASTTPTTGSNLDGFWALQPGWNVEYLGVEYDTVYFGTKMYTTFGAGSTIWSNISPSNPALPKVMVGAADNSAQRIYFGNVGTTPNRQFRVVVEGNAGLSGTLGNPGMRMEYRFFENQPNRILLTIEQNNRKVTSGASTFTSGELNTWGFITGQRIPVRVTALDADIEDAEKEGIISVGAAGNGQWKHDVPGGIDWDNTFEMNNRYPGQVFYYMRGTSPTAVDTRISEEEGFDLNSICVGAIESHGREQKATFSDCGPGVDIYAPGRNIISAFTSGVNDVRGNGIIGKISGTSMASPQVCGVLACMLELFPNMTPVEAKEFIVFHSKKDQLFSGTGGPTDTGDLQGSPNRYLFYPRIKPESGQQVPLNVVKARPQTGSVYPRTNVRRKG